MNDTCKQCGGKCCKTLLIPCDNQSVRSFLEQTRGVCISDSLVLVNSQCRHLDSDGACKVYETRPIACRIYGVDSTGCKLTQANGWKVGL
jgi:Fe-S-cluster containining protein